MLNHNNCMLQHILLMAEVIAKWQMEWLWQGGFDHQLVDVITRWQIE